MKSKLLLMLLLTCISLPSVARPKGDRPFEHRPRDSGFYVGTELGYSENSQTNASYQSIDNASLFGSNSDIGGRLFAGYQFNENYAFEIGYNNTVDMSGSASSGSYSADWDYRVQGIDTSFIYNYPLANHFNVFAKAGLGIYQADVHDEYVYSDLVIDKNQTRVVGIAGTGLEYNFKNHVGLGLSATYQTANDYIPANTLIGVRASYRF
ncbi:outer membrane beta-barrel protein [Shewanella surugensis]|uniref:Outer membrane beta-barrel protein n=1 Tax=Shewanella surugensis TaxID=212020 RepID=A0ABT0LDX6_9GAMM|nr:outer membrane beta-barrel protein [Shewanella surugensis]MCL1125769.1 outer membrane beta-barrel protein [Shewanella surugensis]